ncbi:hypothetical protein ACUWEX_12375 [Okibacterium fritillariae]|uniref:Uncharacterized protein n=1 Tax=Okibacterium fritillariae TaxID=123320 RepID=A0A1T5KSQ7_9MICO|nr:hypothetical protein [Okibacterium fritillariae]SKC66802.1 hypothetical protein SAMN06309945_2449 [Okibacterium fritillariae]
MQEITYASKTFVTTDAISDALLDLVTSIGRASHSEAVNVPAYTETGTRVEAKMTLDASSELVAIPVDLDIDDDSANDEAVEAALRDIRGRISNWSTTAVPVKPEEALPVQFSDEF